MPRWRRPSLLQARKNDPIRDNTPAPRLTFDQGLVGPLDGREGRAIRYRVVRLLDSPDELRGAEIAISRMTSPAAREVRRLLARPVSMGARAGSTR